MKLKLQRPLVSNSDSDLITVLIYNEDRSIAGEVDMAQGFIDLLFDEDEYKVFIEGEVGENGTLTIVDPVVEQEW